MREVRAGEILAGAALEPLVFAAAPLRAAGRRAAVDFAAGLLFEAVTGFLGAFCTRANALTSCSLRIDCQPVTPLFFASSAKSFNVYDLRVAGVIKGSSTSAVSLRRMIAAPMLVSCVLRDEIADAQSLPAIHSQPRA